MLLRCEAFAEPTFLWWDVRPQPRFGTVEVRIMDVQTHGRPRPSALVALVQCIARLERRGRSCRASVLDRPEVLDENRFIAARDGMDARLLDPVRSGSCRRGSARPAAGGLPAARPGARLRRTSSRIVRSLAEGTGAARQLELARGRDGLPGLVSAMATLFTSDAVPGPEGEPAPEDVGLHAAAG